MNENTDNTEQIGELIKKRRKKKQLTIKDLADKTGLSVGFLSQTERNISVPNLTTLSKIANALGVSLGYFITVPGQSTGVNFIKAHNRHYYKYDNGEEICKVHTDNSNQELNSLFTKFPPGFETEESSHESDEVVYCVYGNIVYHVEGTDYHMEPGDIIYVPGNMSHKWSNKTDEDALTLWVSGIEVWAG